MKTIILNSCSKINIGLNILRKRVDGFHDIETIFYPVSLCDTISFKKSDHFIFKCNNESLRNNTGNLVIKAKNKIEELTGIQIQAEIILDKYIPLGGGLGGGSSNAACTLKGLCMLYELNINDYKLRNAALELGSDVPFFLNPKPSYATSRGEVLELIDLRINNPILIVNPGIHISTKWAFENISPSAEKKSLRETINESIIPEKFREYYTNDFEDIVLKTYPEIKAIKDYMYNSGALFSLLSGTGSTVYGIFSNFDDARKVQNNLSNYLSFIHYEE